jgi:hypothetical protein
MYLGSFLFAMFFVMIAPPSRNFMLKSMAVGGAWMMNWAPFSFILLAILIAAPMAAIHLIRSWPKHVEPENPMAKYRRDPLYEADEL